MDNEKVSQMAAEALLKIGEEHADMCKKRKRMQSYGFAFLGLNVGHLLGNLARTFLATGAPLATWEWWLFWISIPVVLIVAYCLRYNYRCIKAHYAACVGILGVLRNEPGSTARMHHLDQAQAAMTEVELLVLRRRSKKNADQVDSNATSGGNP